MRYALAVVMVGMIMAANCFAFDLREAIKFQAIPAERGSMSCVAVGGGNYTHCFILMREGDKYFAMRIEVKP